MVVTGLSKRPDSVRHNLKNRRQYAIIAEKSVKKKRD